MTSRWLTRTIRDWKTWTPIFVYGDSPSNSLKLIGPLTEEFGVLSTLKVGKCNTTLSQRSATALFIGMLKETSIERTNISLWKNTETCATGDMLPITDTLVSLFSFFLNDSIAKMVWMFLELQLRNKRRDCQQSLRRACTQAHIGGSTQTRSCIPCLPWLRPRQEVQPPFRILPALHPTNYNTIFIDS